MSSTGTHKNENVISILCQRSTIFLSSSSAALEYVEKKGPELSAKFDSPCHGWFDIATGPSQRSSVRG